MNFFPQSIRWRVQIWYTLLLAAIVGALLVAFFENQKEIKYQTLDRELNSPITRLLPRMDRLQEPPRRTRRLPRSGRPDDFESGPGPRRGREGEDGPPERRPDPGGFGRPTLDEVVEELAADEIFVARWDPRGELQFTSNNTPSELPPIPEDTPRGEDQILKRTVNGYREIVHASPGGGFILVGTSIAPIEKELDSLRIRLLGIGTLIVGGGFLVGWLLLGRSLKPIRQISETAHRISEGDLSDRIAINEDGSELGKLSSVLNETFEKLDSSFEHQVRFTADASHEMRTPIAVILAKSQFALSRERTPEKYQEALQTCMDSAQHMRTLTDSLLELSKVDAGEFNLQKTEGNLGELTRDVVRMIEPLAQEKGIKVHDEIDKMIMVFDAQKMRQALLNLLSNAVKYNHEGGKIEVTLNEENDEARLSIRDTGPGISKDALPHVFERFYRVDKARKRGGTGGTGLGLAITRAIIESHDGQIEVESELGEGTIFRVQLPKQRQEG